MWCMEGQGMEQEVCMPVYLDLFVILNFFVDLLLIVGANRLAGYPPGLKRALPAAGIGAGYGTLCLLPGFLFLGNLFWRIVFLIVMALVAYGMNKAAARRGVLFVLLSMALGGIASSMNHNSFWGLLIAALGVCVLCLLGFRGKALGGSCVPVEVEFGGRKVTLNALRDTGNTLRDPVTGEAVLVAGACAARELLGLRTEQLMDPVLTMVQCPVQGLRLIPYRAVGTSGGMLLAIRCPRVRIGEREGPGVVAFTASGLDGNSEFQALTGGI